MSVASHNILWDFTFSLFDQYCLFSEYHDLRPILLCERQLLKCIPSRNAMFLIFFCNLKPFIARYVTLRSMCCVSGNRRRRPAVAEKWDDDEVPGTEAGTCAQTLLPHRQTPTESVVMEETEPSCCFHSNLTQRTPLSAAFAVSQLYFVGRFDIFYVHVKTFYSWSWCFIFTFVHLRGFKLFRICFPTDGSYCQLKHDILCTALTVILMSFHIFLC